jgi:predicted Zn-dependent peptidase
MIHTFELFPGVTLRCYPDQRFKHSCLSVQLVRPMRREEAACNALLPAVLLRGCKRCPDLRDITLQLDDLYGASVGTLVRRVGDYQTTGLYASFIEDRYAMDGDAVLAPMAAFIQELLLEPVLEDGVFSADFVEGEKKNLISTIESQLNDKRAYAMEQMIRRMCKEDTFGLSRLGEKEDVAAITPKALYAHYQNILHTSRIDVFYVGSAPAEQVAQLVKTMLKDIPRNYVNLPEQTGFHTCPGGSYEEQMDVNQGKLCMGFTSPVTTRDKDFVVMQVLNMIFGGGMTSKLFMHIREKLSLCYAIGSGYHGTKGIFTVSAGIDSGKSDLVQAEILNQLEACRQGNITEDELNAAKQALRAGLLSTPDAPASIENYYASAALSGLTLTPEAYMAAVEQVTAEQVAEAAKKLELHTVYFLKGVTE